MEEKQYKKVSDKFEAVIPEKKTTYTLSEFKEKLEILEGDLGLIREDIAIYQSKENKIVAEIKKIKDLLAN